MDCFLSHRGRTRPLRTLSLAPGHQKTLASWTRSLLPPATRVGLSSMLRCFWLCSKVIWRGGGRWQDFLLSLIRYSTGEEKEMRAGRRAGFLSPPHPGYRSGRTCRLNAAAGSCPAPDLRPRGLEGNAPAPP